MGLKPQSARNSKADEKHQLKSALTAISLKVQMAKKILDSSKLSKQQTELVNQFLTGALDEVTKVSQMIDDLW